MVDVSTRGRLIVIYKYQMRKRCKGTPNGSGACELMVPIFSKDLPPALGLLPPLLHRNRREIGIVGIAGTTHSDAIEAEMGEMGRKDGGGSPP